MSCFKIREYIGKKGKGWNKMQWNSTAQPGGERPRKHKALPSYPVALKACMCSGQCKFAPLQNLILKKANFTVIKIMFSSQIRLPQKLIHRVRESKWESLVEVARSRNAWWWCRNQCWGYTLCTYKQHKARFSSRKNKACTTLSPAIHSYNRGKVGLSAVSLIDGLRL